jgi:hypothetical protein
MADELVIINNLPSAMRIGEDSSDATATAADILLNKTAYVNGKKIIGAIVSKESETYIPTTTAQVIESGQYISGNQIIEGDTNLLSSNIKKGVSIFGVDGILDSEGGSTIVDNQIMDTSSLTSSSEVYAYLNNGEDCYVSNINDNTKYEKITDNYDFSSNTMACAYDTVGGISMAGISIRSTVENRGVLLKKFTLTNTHGLIYINSLVSDWITPTIQFVLIPPSAVVLNETESYLRIDFSKKVFEKNIILSPKYNGQRIFLEVTGLPIGEYYPAILVPSKIEGNTAIISQIGILEI